MTIHLVYPVNFNRISAPWSIGNNLYNYLIKNFDVKIYQWTSYEKANPKKGDILIGHAHPNPFTCFRRSMRSNLWQKKILMQPFNCDPYQVSYLYKIIQDVDIFLAITGDYWIDNIKNTIFKQWKNKIKRLDLAIDLNHYPLIKKKFNKKNNRKFIYIGNDYRFNNYAKNLEYLKKIIYDYHVKYFATIGNKKIEGVKHYGWMDFKKKEALDVVAKYDFLITVSKFDANPVTILESMAWGLIPIVTKQCGYYRNKGIINVPLNNIGSTKKILERYNKISFKILNKKKKKNFLEIKKKYNWGSFCEKVEFFIKSKKKNYYFINYTKNEIEIFKKNIKNSPNYYLNYKNLLLFILSNFKYFIKKSLGINNDIV